MVLPAVTRTGSVLKVNGVPQKFSGMNAYWLGVSDVGNTNNTPIGYVPTNAQILAGLQGMKAMGANLVRSTSIGVSVGSSYSFEPSPGTFTSANLASADYAIQQAGLLGIYLTIPLFDNWNYYSGGIWNFVHWAYQANPTGLVDCPGTSLDDPNARQFFGNTTAQLRIRALADAYVTAWMNHVNSLTGVAYKDDPTIAFIETGNELYFGAQAGNSVEYMTHFANLIKTLAPNKLVVDGSGADGQWVSTHPGLAVANVDVMSPHYYPADPSSGLASGFTAQSHFRQSGSGGTTTGQLDLDVAAALGANKAIFVGEYPWTRSDAATWYSYMENKAGLSGDLMWSFQMNNTNGTPVSGGQGYGGDNVFLHYPYPAGFETTYGPVLSGHITREIGTAVGAAPTTGEEIFDGVTWVIYGQAPVVTATVPSAPTNMTVSPLSTQITVAVSPPTTDGGSPITGYTWTLNPGNVTATSAAGVLSHIFTGLTPSTTYTLTARAVNAIGAGLVVTGTGVTIAQGAIVKPNATNTGCRTPRANLTPITGAAVTQAMKGSNPKLVWRNYLITGAFDFQAGFDMADCIIESDAPGTQSAYRMVEPQLINQGTAWTPGGKISYCTIDGMGSVSGGAPLSAIVIGPGAQIDHCNIAGAQDCIDAAPDCIITDNYIHRSIAPAGAHSDGVQFTGGGDWNNIVFQRNNIDLTDSQGPINSCIELGYFSTAGANYNNWTITDNWFDGSGSQINGYWGYSPAPNSLPTNMTILRNRFGLHGNTVVQSQAQPFFRDPTNVYDVTGTTSGGRQVTAGQPIF